MVESRRKPHQVSMTRTIRQQPRQQRQKPVWNGRRLSPLPPQIQLSIKQQHHQHGKSLMFFNTTVCYPGKTTDAKARPTGTADRFASKATTTKYTILTHKHHHKPGQGVAVDSKRAGRQLGFVVNYNKHRGTGTNYSNGWALSFNQTSSSGTFDARNKPGGQ